MYHRLRYFCFLLIGMLGLAATCERPLDLELHADDRNLVVISNFTPDRSIEVLVSRTQPILEQQDTSYITTATVELYRGEVFLETLTLRRDRGRPPYYTSDSFRPEAEVEYRLRVEVDGYETVKAMSMIPPQVGIDEIEIVEQIDSMSGDQQIKFYTISMAVTFTDPAQQENFYHLRLLQEYESFGSGSPDTMGVPLERRQVEFQIQSPDSRYQIRHIDRGLLLEDTPFNGKRQRIVLTFQVSLDSRQERLGPTFAELRSVSKEYYLFYSSLSRQLAGGEVPFAEPVIIFNNISGGQGNFSGFNPAEASAQIGR